MTIPSARSNRPGHPATHPTETSRAPERSSPVPASEDDDVPGHVAPTVRRRIVHEFRRCGVLPARGFADPERPEANTSLTGAYGRAFAMALIALSLVGCGTGQAGKVLRAENAYAFYRARYAEACPEPPVSAPCLDKAGRLRALHGAVQEAADALKRGGPCPLQVERLERLAEEYPR